MGFSIGILGPALVSRFQNATPQAALRDARLEKEAAEARIRELELAAKEARKIHEKRLKNVCHVQ